MAEPESGAQGFAERHIGPDGADIALMLQQIGVASLEELIDRAVPASIRWREPLPLGEPLTEDRVLAQARELAGRNRPFRSLIGMGYAACITPPVIQRNILENPGWYTHYTPYQAEISQGRLEALLNFQTMVIDLTGMEIANASLLDEATAAAEAVSMLHAVQRRVPGEVVFASQDCHPQTLAVLRTRALARGWEVVAGDHRTFAFDPPVFAALLQYPASDGALYDYAGFVERAHQAGVLVVVAADLLALSLMRPPGEFGADATVGSTQRFGMPMGYGGPHAAFLATRGEYRRHLPGRIIGVSVDTRGRPALRMALQTREQHIRRERATSNICTAQVLPAVVASMYGVYHGPEGLRRIARGIHQGARKLAQAARELGGEVVHAQYFDTLRLRFPDQTADSLCQRARERRLNFRPLGERDVGITLDETCGPREVEEVVAALAGPGPPPPPLLGPAGEPAWESVHQRRTPFLQHPVFHAHRSETEMLRYIRLLEGRDLSLAQAMIPLGSCTMKLNPTAAMVPITWPAFADLHPFVPAEQAAGYHAVFEDLGRMLCQITGMAAVSLQPNSGAQGEYTGLLVIRRYHEAAGQGHRRICLIPASAHGTNPASAALAGLEVVVVACDEAGNIDVEDLETRAAQHAERLAAFMVTYPSTHGVFEEEIGRICAVVHRHGGQVYLDGANMNALVGLCRPAQMGADVCHLNLHKTFAIPHGGGGPGMGPIAVAAHLAPFLPTHPVVTCGGEQGIGAVAAAPYGSALVLLISWAYLRMLGGEGARMATAVAILNANYLASRLHSSFPVLYRGRGGLVAHEAILDLRGLKRATGITVEDVAKRLMDYGYHAPTVSFPVPDTLMVEPTESESRAELDRFCQAMTAIRAEIAAIERGLGDPHDNPLCNAPHTADMVCAEDWHHPYSRQQAALPAPWSLERKFWPAVGRVDNAHGDRHLVCACPPVQVYAGAGGSGG
ncbi:MAG: aminomethyl-transferring glycine dehydrogenase [Candidatus Latescibacterota bacterium]